MVNRFGFPLATVAKYILNNREEILNTIKSSPYDERRQKSSGAGQPSPFYICNLTFSIIFLLIFLPQVLVASNWTSESTVSVRGLLPQSNYIISVKAVNERGESSPVYVGGKTEGLVQSLPIGVGDGSRDISQI